MAGASCSAESANTAGSVLGSQQKSKLAELITKQLDPTDSTPLNPYEIKNYIYFGFSDAALRPKYWKMLLNYYSKNQFKSESFYRSSRRSYHEIEQGLANDAKETARVAEMVEKDLSRTSILLADELAAYREPIRRILLVFARTNRSIGYVQGMISLVIPLFHVLAQSPDPEDVQFAEADAFFLFSNLMAEIGDSFVGQFDDMPNGLNGRIGAMLGIIREKDAELYDAIVAKDLDKSGFAIRWVLLMFSAEFKIDAVVWLWDRILSDSYRFEMLTYCCAAAVVLVRSVIITMDFEKCMDVLQNPSILNVEVLFDIADAMRRGGADAVDAIKTKSV